MDVKSFMQMSTKSSGSLLSSLSSFCDYYYQKQRLTSPSVLAMFHFWTPLPMIFRLVTIIITKCYPHRQAIFSLKVRITIIPNIVIIAVILATTHHPLQKTASSLVKSRLALGSQGLSVVCLSSCRICLEDKKIVFDFVQVIEAIKLFFSNKTRP